MKLICIFLFIGIIVCEPCSLPTTEVKTANAPEFGSGSDKWNYILSGNNE